MMKILYITLFFTFISCAPEVSRNPNDYANYNASMLIAENLFLNSNIDSALIVYNRLFNEYEDVFFKELNNAFVCYIKKFDYSNALRISKQMVLKGAELSYFSKDQFSDFSNTEHFEELKCAYPVLRQEYLSSQNDSLRAEYYSLLRIDQHYNNKYRNSSAESIIENSRNADSIFYMNMNKFLRLESKYGFPNFFRDKDSLQTLRVLFYHFVQMEQKVKDDSILKKDVLYGKMEFDSININEKLRAWHRDGLIDLDFLEGIYYIIDLSNLSSNIGMIVYDFDKEEVRVNFNYNMLDVVNLEREELGLPAITEDYRLRVEAIWSSFDFKPLKEAYKNCAHINDNDCFNTLFVNFRQSYLSSLFSEKGFEGFLFSHALMPKSVVRDDFAYRKFIEENYGFNN